MEWISNPEIWIGLLTLTILEIVLGIDNLVFISILSAKLPESQQARARQVGLALALITRILLLFSLSWLIGLTEPLFSVFGLHIAGRDLILMGGGLFLLAKSTREIHLKLEGEDEHGVAKTAVSFSSVIIQIMLLDVVFSLDSVITAIGLTNEIWIIITAVILSFVAILAFAGPIGNFIMDHPALKILALSFLITIGITIFMEGLHQHVPKAYIYLPMGFALSVEMLQMWYERNKKLKGKSLRRKNR